MAEPTVDLDAEFAAFRAATLPHITPAGPDAVRRRMRKRRRAIVTTIVAAMTTLVVGPVAGYATLDRAPRPPDPVVVVTPSGQPDPSVSPHASASPSAAATSPAAPDGRISRTDLLRTRLDLPPWAAKAGTLCDRSDVRLVEKATGQAGQLPLTAHRYADVDGDGAEETVTTIDCLDTLNGTYQQVVVFDRDTRGRIVTLGQVVRTDTTRQAESHQIARIADLGSGSSGAVRVRIGDLWPFDDELDEWVQWQWRTYRWTGRQFAQVAGPTAFGPNPLFNDLVVTGATDIVLTARDPQTRAGSTTVTVRNAGRTDARNATVTLLVPVGFGPDGAGWPNCAGQPTVVEEATYSMLSCGLGALAAGESHTVTLGVVGPADDPAPGTGSATVHDMYSPLHSVPDPRQENNRRRFEIR
ncbi:hypothetical protein [Plantactinospora sp. GCM10030261]|uniref:hypothetical protein n=1 Tax=Plantactinospora sp. GCM10030261 TaxID=3273420 RepID=UPI00360F6583